MWIEYGTAMADRVQTPLGDDGLVRYLRTEYGATSLGQLAEAGRARKGPRRGVVALLMQILGVHRRR